MNPSESPLRFPPPDNQTFGPTFAQQTNSTLQRHENLIYLGLIIVALSLVAVVVGCVAVVLDQLHFNNQLYKDGGYIHTVVEQQTVKEQPITVTFPNLKPHQ